MINAEYRRIPADVLTGTATHGFIFGGPRVFYDDMKEGGWTITVHADEPGETHGNNQTDDNDLPRMNKENRISTNELSKVNNRTSENCTEKQIEKWTIIFARNIMILPKCT